MTRDFTPLKNSIKSSLQDAIPALVKTKDHVLKYGKVLAPGIGVSVAANTVFGEDPDRARAEGRLEGRADLAREEFNRVSGIPTGKELEKRKKELSKKEIELDKDLQVIEYNKKKTKDEEENRRNAKEQEERIKQKQNEINKEKNDPDKKTPVLASLVSPEMIQKMKDNKYAIGGAGLAAAAGGLGYLAYRKLKKKKSEREVKNG